MPGNKESDISPFNASTQLHLRWLSANITIYDFAPEGKFLVSMFHSHKYMELLVVHSGEGVARICGAPPVPLKSGSLLYMNKNVSHKVEAHPIHPLSTYLILFTVEPCASNEKIPREWMEDENLIIDKILNHQYLFAEDKHNCIQELEHMRQSAQTRNVGEFVKIKNYLSNLIMSAFQSFVNLPTRIDFEDILLNTPILNTSRITKYISDHFTENITLTSVAESLFYSPRQCQRIIQDNLGVSFSDYLTDLRLTYAKRLLVTTNYSMEKTAECSGFKSEKSFSHLFQMREGVTPYRYQKEHKIGSASKAAF